MNKIGSAYNVVAKLLRHTFCSRYRVAIVYQFKQCGCRTYWRVFNNAPFQFNNNSFRTSIAKYGITIVGIYRQPPDVPSFWNHQDSFLLNVSSEVSYLYPHYLLIAVVQICIYCVVDPDWIPCVLKCKLNTRIIGCCRHFLWWSHLLAKLAD